MQTVKKLLFFNSIKFLKRFLLLTEPFLKCMFVQKTFLIKCCNKKLLRRNWRGRRTRRETKFSGNKDFQILVNTLEILNSTHYENFSKSNIFIRALEFHAQSWLTVDWDVCLFCYYICNLNLVASIPRGASSFKLRLIFFHLASIGYFK